MRSTLIPLTPHLDDRGFFQEILKSSQITKFGQWSMAYMHTGVIKAWHVHSIQWDYWFVPNGVITAVVADISKNPLFDEAFDKTSKIITRKFNGEIFEYRLGDNQKPTVLVIPPGFAHGLKVLQGPATLMYITSEEYNPADEGRLHYSVLPYDWYKVEIK